MAVVFYVRDDGTAGSYGAATDDHDEAIAQTEALLHADGEGGWRITAARDDDAPAVPFAVRTGRERNPR